jgi:AcrR family transcriptional regulator
MGRRGNEAPHSGGGSGRVRRARPRRDDRRPDREARPGQPRTRLQLLRRQVEAVLRTADVGEFAGRTFDYQRAHPDLARLVLWEGLSDTGSVPDEIARTELYADKAEAMAAAQQAGLLDDTLDPAHLVFLVIALSSYWSAAPHIARMLSGSDAQDSAEAARRRAAVVHAAQQIAAPRTTPTA